MANPKMSQAQTWRSLKKRGTKEKEQTGRMNTD
jgi:hypothetical protein